MVEAIEDEASRSAEDAATTPAPSDRDRGKTIHGDAADSGHRVLAPDDAEVEVYLETALKAAAPDRSPDDRPGGATTAAPGPVVVLDFGSQFAQLIARRVRELDVYSELLPHDTPYEELERRGTQAIILSGGPNSVYDDDAPKPDPAIWGGRIPVLGICYGAQLMARELGGDVLPAGKREYGPANVTITTGDGLFDGIEPNQPVWMSHGDSIVRPPEGFQPTAQTDSSPYAGLADPGRNLYGIQFHPEVVHTPHGTQVLTRFLRDIAGCRERWTPASVIDEQVDAIRSQVGEGRAICGLSGGVDSATAALLVHRAIGERLTCVFVDHGMMRKDEASQVVEAFRERLGVPLVHVDAADRFLDRLAGVDDPETKRKIIGEEFIRVFEEQAAEVGDAGYLVQGTLYSDVIESGGDGREAATIKSHHNVGGLPDEMEMELVEPLRTLFKDEVRAVAAELDLPDRFVWRQPFPGPGLAIRVVGGEVTRERLEILRSADAILQEEVRAAGLYRELWQSFCVLPVVRSVGVQGDERSYSYPIVIRAVTSDDAMTADWARLPYDLLERASNRIINEVPGVNRVTLDITSKPPGTIEWE